MVNIIQNAHRIPQNRLSVGGYGESRPIASNDTEEGRERNRRIDILVEIKPDRQGTCFNATIDRLTACHSPKEWLPRQLPDV